MKLHTVMILDKHPIFQRAIEMTLNEITIMEKVYKLSSGEEAIDRLKNNVDLIILDIFLSDTNAFSFMRKARKLGYKGEFCIFTEYNFLNFYKTSMEVGALCYIMKSDSIHKVKEILSKVIIKRAKYRSTDMSKFENKLHTLSEKELLVYLYSSNGLSNNEMAKKMDVSCKTISTFKARGLNKINKNHLSEVF